MNEYTARWFDLFLRPIDQQQTAREVAFVSRHLPQPRYSTLVDVCCGSGRHSHQLAAAGYTTIGIDRDARSIAEARARALPSERYLEHDMRQLAELGLQADAVLCLWQSFGYFDPATNQAILRDIAAMLPAGGRLMLDIYHRDFFAAHQGTRTFDLSGTQISETKMMVNDRLQVTLAETDGTPIDSFDWHVFTPAECLELAQSAGLTAVLSCTNYDEQQRPAATLPRVQYIFEQLAGA